MRGTACSVQRAACWVLCLALGAAGANASAQPAAPVERVSFQDAVKRAIEAGISSAARGGRCGLDFSQSKDVGDVGCGYYGCKNRCSGSHSW